MLGLKERGAAGEKLAREYLESNNYIIEAQNFKAIGGEIDLIARQEQRLYFVEVKTRWTDLAGSPLEQVTPAKQRQIARVAMAFLQQYPQMNRYELYFGVIGIDASCKPPVIQWIPEAFEARISL